MKGFHAKQTNNAPHIMTLFNNIVFKDSALKSRVAILNLNQTGISANLKNAPVITNAPIL